MPHIKHFTWLLDKQKGPRWLPMLTWIDEHIMLKKREKTKKEEA